MTHTRISLLWMAAAALAMSVLFSSCIEDGFTTSSSDVLAFNMDTVAFDTVITLQGTATKQMVVYNRSKKQINISSIKVAGLADKGHFYLNVDGIRGDEFHNVEIRGNDSIFIFIEARLDEMEQDDPTLLEDRLLFETNGVSQSVLLSAWGQDVIRINGDTISHNTLLRADKPYLIYDTLFVAPGVTLSLQAGTTLLFHDKAAIRCAGRMLANGTAEAPVVFRGDRLDRIVGETSFDIMSGQWGGVIFTPPTMGNVLKHVIMRGSSIGMHCSANGDTSRCALKLVNCVLTNSASTCLATAACYVQAIGTEISDAAEEVAYFAGGKVEAVHCTFANYYLFAVPSLPIVNVFDVEFADGTVGIALGGHFGFVAHLLAIGVLRFGGRLFGAGTVSRSFLHGILGGRGAIIVLGYGLGFFRGRAIRIGGFVRGDGLVAGRRHALAVFGGGGGAGSRGV